MLSELPLDAPLPRLYHLIKWADNDVYGFRMQDGQIIAQVYIDSPAHHIGLKKGDRIIEVNGVITEIDNFQKFSEELCSIPNETKLLVVDEDAYMWYQKRNIVVKSTLPNVKFLKTPAQRTNMLSLLPVDTPIPRLCHLLKWADSDFYGFTMQDGQIIAEVDADSPAYHSGLKKGDHIVEVNNVNIEEENFLMVSEWLYSIPSEVRLLVVDGDAYIWFWERNITVKRTLPNVKYYKTPAQRPNMLTVLPADAPIPQLSHLIKWPYCDAYEFKIQQSQISEVYRNTAAQYSGLKIGDLIVEVNDVNTEKENFQKVLEIRSIPNETKLLAVDENAYMQERNIAVESTLPNIQFLKTPSESQHSTHHKYITKIVQFCEGIFTDGLIIILSIIGFHLFYDALI